MILQSVNLKQQYPISYRFVLKKTFIAFVISLICFYLVLFFLIPRLGISTYEISTLEITLLALVCFSIAIYKLIYYSLYHLLLLYRIEDTSIMMSKGVILKEQIILPFLHVTDIFIKRDFLDFLFGLHTLTISSASDYKNEFVVIEGFGRKSADGLRHELRKALVMANSGNGLTGS